jgi:hypothetical protein
MVYTRQKLICRVATGQSNRPIETVTEEYFEAEMLFRHVWGIFRLISTRSGGMGKRHKIIARVHTSQAARESRAGPISWREGTDLDLPLHREPPYLGTKVAA